MEANRAYASVWERFLVIPGLLLTTFLTSSLFAARFEHWTSTPDFTTFVKQNRSATGIIVQVLSHILGMMHVYILCRLPCPGRDENCFLSLVYPTATDFTMPQVRQSIYQPGQPYLISPSLWTSSNSSTLCAVPGLSGLYRGATASHWLRSWL